MFGAILRFAVTVAAIPLCAQYMDGVHMTDWLHAALIGAILAVLYMVLRPLARLLLKVVNWLTLGLLYVVVDAWLVWTAVGMLGGAVTVDSFWWAVAVALVVNAARTLIGALTGKLREQEYNMHIFLVNDDGIHSTGIHALCQAALERGHRVSLCAPSSQQSAASQRITLLDPIYVEQYDLGQDGAQAWAITGTPTDCVRLGLFELVKEPVDVLISGINDGYNAGMAVHYSGTVGAATEGALNRVRAMAVSVHHEATQEMYDYVARLAIATAERYVGLKTPPATILNMNAPLREPAEMRVPVLAPLSTANFKDCYIRRESPRKGVYYWMANECRTDEPEAGTDLDMLNKGHVTYTFMGNPSEHGAAFASFVREMTKVDVTA